LQERCVTIALTVYDWVYGIAQISAVVLSVIAGIIAGSMFRSAHRARILSAWRYLIPALILFVVEELVGAARTFGFWTPPVYLTHVLASLIIGCVIAALVVQREVNEACLQ
jgi:hypothetical protein